MWGWMMNEYLLLRFKHNVQKYTKNLSVNIILRFTEWPNDDLG